MKSLRSWPLYHALALLMTGVFTSASAQTIPAPDPEARKAVIQSIPTGIVYVNGNEVGRILGDQAWQSPESTLRAILAASATTGGSR